MKWLSFFLLSILCGIISAELSTIDRGAFWNYLFGIAYGACSIILLNNEKLFRK